MAGLAAALYLRGIRVVQVPTSLLAMVDSSVGGKTAVDLPAGKTSSVRSGSRAWSWPMCPRSPRSRPSSSATPAARWSSTPSSRTPRCSTTSRTSLTDDADEGRLAATVARNVEIKRDVVSADERERGLRQTLNLGHTIGHAIEAASDFSLGHGSCVAAGLCVMTRAAAARGWCSAETAARVERCVAAHGLPTGTDLPADVLMRYVAHDKKRHGDGVNIVVPREVGRCEVRRASLDELRDLMELGR